MAERLVLARDYRGNRLSLPYRQAIAAESSFVIRAENKERGEEEVVEDVGAFLKMYQEQLKTRYTSNYDDFLKELKRIVGSIGAESSGYLLTFENVRFVPPTRKVGEQIFNLYPQVARRSGLSYTCKVVADAVIQRKGEVESGAENVVICDELPLMVMSENCHLSHIDRGDLPLYGEDPYDYGGYFIINGKEVVLKHLEMLVMEKLHIMLRDTGKKLVCRMTSQTSEASALSEVSWLRTSGKRGNSIDNVIKFQIQRDVLWEFVDANRHTKAENPILLPVYHVFRLLGVTLKEASDVILEMTCKECRGRVGSLLRIFENNAATDLTGFDPEGVAPALIGEDITKEERFLLFFRYISNGENKGFDLGKYIEKNKDWRENLLVWKQNVVDAIFPQITEAAKRLFISKSKKAHSEMVLNSKRMFLGMMCAYLIEAHIEKRGLTNLDSWAEKKLRTPGEHLLEGWRSAWRSMMQRVTIANTTSINKLVDVSSMNKAMNDIFSVKRWNGEKTDGCEIPQQLLINTPSARVASLSTTDVNVTRTTPNETIRKVEPDSAGYIDPFNTPEGKSVGLPKQITMSAGVTQISDIDPVTVSAILRELKIAGISQKRSEESQERVIFNGIPLGWANGARVKQALLDMRKNGELDKHLSIVLREGWLYIERLPSRLTRPLYVCKDNRILAEVDGVDIGDANISELVAKGYVEYITAAEQNEVSVADSRIALAELREKKSRVSRDIKIIKEALKGGDTSVESSAELVDKLVKLETLSEKLKQMGDYDYCNLCGISAQSATVAMIPAIDRNQAPRNSYQAGMSKQGLVNPHVNIGRRNTDNLVKHQQVCQPSMCTTNVEEIFGCDDTGIGNCVNLGFLAARGTEEDSHKWGRQISDFGANYNVLIQVAKTQPTSGAVIARPNLSAMKPHEIIRYCNIMENGYPIIGSTMIEGDCIIGSVITEGNKEKNVSVFLKKGDAGTVLSVIDNTSHISVCLHVVRRPSVGDKSAPRNAQKATSSIIVNPHDMPYDPRTGERVDVLTHPTQQPSRMTFSFTAEQVGGKRGALEGRRQSLCPYNRYDPRDPELVKTLESYGYSANGEERFVNPAEGQFYEDTISVGVVGMQTLVHMANHKLQARASGPHVPTTGQPTKGKASGGGLRLGEMEKDGILAHGATAFARERFSDLSDGKEVAICLNCHQETFYQYDENGGNFNCTRCGSEDIGRYIVPRTSNYARDLIGAAGIRIETIYEKSEDRYERMMEEHNKQVTLNCEIEDLSEGEFSGSEEEF